MILYTQAILLIILLLVLAFLLNSIQKYRISLEQFCLGIYGLPVLFFHSLWLQIIYVARNAKDTVVSYFHFDCMNMVQPEPGDWSSFLQRFMEGKSE